MGAPFALQARVVPTMIDVRTVSATGRLGTKRRRVRDATGQGRMRVHRGIVGSLAAELDTRFSRTPLRCGAGGAWGVSAGVAPLVIVAQTNA